MGSVNTPATDQKELTAGRELDALVAEKVMGWRRSRGCFEKGNGWNPDGVILVPYPPTYQYVKEPLWTTDPITRDGIYPNYSTDIAAAWEVLSKFERGWTSRLVGNAFSVVVYPTDMIGYMAESASFTEAVCLAALKAVQQ